MCPLSLGDHVQHIRLVKCFACAMKELCSSALSMRNTSGMSVTPRIRADPATSPPPCLGVSSSMSAPRWERPFAPSAAVKALSETVARDLFTSAGMSSWWTKVCWRGSHCCFELSTCRSRMWSIGQSLIGWSITDAGIVPLCSAHHLSYRQYMRGITNWRRSACASNMPERTYSSCSCTRRMCFSMVYGGVIRPSSRSRFPSHPSSAR
mmetsp:Transcript_17841/g.46149  ORF Transcript_17841/g.46149 Transcript_17841/m.46149 type:complete len:208 (+) Transcript_17841:417-1040(+)